MDGDSRTYTAADRLRLWSDELSQELLPEQEVPGTPVLLACDDESIRVVAERLGFESEDPSVQFGHDVCVAFHLGKISGWKEIVAGAWERAPRPRPLPIFFPVLCLWVLAASRMAPDEKHPTSEYHGRLCHLLGVSGDDTLPCFNFIGSRFQDLAEWLERDLEGRHGHLIVPTNPHPAHVGYAVAQTVFRLRDRQVLSKFFTERLSGSIDGFDPLRRLQRWSGRGQLTGHALRLVENDDFADRVRAAIRAAFRSWDGAELVETTGGRVGRLWPATIRLVIYPTPRLQFGARHPKPIELTLDGDQKTLAPGRELELPWTLVACAADRSIDLGDVRGSSGGVRLPRLGETLIFENGEEGLLWVERPSAKTVWVLTSTGALRDKLARWRFNDGGALPVGWGLFFNVPVDELPGADRAALQNSQQTPLQIEGGLSLERRLYLSGHPPYLVAGDLETEERLPVTVNGMHYGYISSGERIVLRAEQGRYDVEVGEGYFTMSYDVEEAGEPLELRLCHQLDGEHALRSSARLENTERGGVVVCGATIDPPYGGDVPFLTRVLCDVETICANGALVAHERPPTPAWFSEVGLHQRGRWELICEEPLVWLLMPPAGRRPRVRLVADIKLMQLEPEATSRVLALGAEVDVLPDALDATASRARWEMMLEQAKMFAATGASE